MKKNYAFQIVSFWMVLCLSLSFYPGEVKGDWDMESAENYLEHQYREWKLADGTSLWAKYDSVGKNTIILVDEDFHPIVLKTWELSKEDAKFQRDMWKKYHGKVQGNWNEESAQRRKDREYREWELADGTKIFAQYKDVGKNTILLVDIEGTPVILKTSDLSKEDAVFQRKQWNKHLKEERKERAEKRKQR